MKLFKKIFITLLIILILEYLLIYYLHTRSIDSSLAFALINKLSNYSSLMFV